VGAALRIASIAGIPIRIHASWLAIYALITWTLAVGYFPQALPELGAAAWWVSGLIAALLLFVAVLLHELSHAFVARAHGLRVRGITLHVFGGVSHLEDEPPSARAEFLIAVVGPLTSLGLAGLLWVINAVGLVPAGSPRAIVRYLVAVNAAVGVFNLLPGFPLDGGRLLRAILWRWKGTLARATYLASRVGAGVAFALVGLGVLQILAGGLVGGFWLVLIGLFLRGAADASYAQTALRKALEHLLVRDIMVRDVVAVAPETSLEELVEKFWTHHVTSFPVVRDGRVYGIAAVHDLRGVPRERWPQARAEEVMRPLGEELVVAQGDSVVRALQKAAGNGLGRLAVVESGRLVGYLSLKDITHVLVLRGLAPLRAENVDVPRAVRELERAA
jgi:Zn-dependent protease/CBS domain-containing protein